MNLSKLPVRLPSRQVLLAVALAAFCLILFWAVRTAQQLLDQLQLLPFLILLFVFQPVAMILGSAEFRIAALMVRTEFSWRASLEVVILTRASDLLPLAAGTVTRIAALKGRGVTVRRASLLTMMLVALSGALAFLYAGLWVQVVAVKIAFVTIGLVAFAAAIAIGRRLAVPLRLTGAALGVRIALLSLETAALMLGARCLGVELHFAQAAPLVVASFVTMIVSVVPAGLGVREAAIAALSPLVSLEPAVGFIIATTGRIAGLLGLAAATLLLLVLQRTGRAGATPAAAGSGSGGDVPPRPEETTAMPEVDHRAGSRTS